MSAVRLWQRVTQIRWIGYAAALVAVALVSVLIGFVPGRATIANISMLYLTAVLAVAVAFGSGPAVLASVVAFLTFDFFFTEPYYTFTVANPDEWVALLLFLLTAMITGQLAAGQRRRAQDAERREREAVILYDVVRLIGQPGLESSLNAVAERLRQELELDALVIHLDDGAKVQAHAAVGEAGARRLAELGVGAAHRVLGAGRDPAAAHRGVPGRWRRIVPPSASRFAGSGGRGQRYRVPVQAQDQPVGSMVMVCPAGAPVFTIADDRLLSAVAGQLGQAVERVRLRQEAMEAEILRRTDELKTALLNAVSHDLRTPLTSINTAAGSLLQEDVNWSDAERREFAEAIEQETLRLNRIIGNLLDMSRMEAGSLRPDKRWHDVATLVNDVLGRLRTVTGRHRVTVDLPDDLPPVLLDYVEMDQTLSNLVENAAKYAPSGSEILVAARRVGEEVEVAVADRGPGIPAAALPRLFTAFYRGDGSVPLPQGTGLGLAIARGLVEAHHGRIRAENRKGGGARFIVTLPLGDLTVAEEPVMASLESAS